MGEAKGVGRNKVCFVGGSQYTRTWVTSHISKTMFNMNFEWVMGFCIATQVCENIKEWTKFIFLCIWRSLCQAE
jgi:hypothetical protein